MMVLPNKFPIKLSDLVDAVELKAPEPEVGIRYKLVLTLNKIMFLRAYYVFMLLKLNI